MSTDVFNYRGRHHCGETSTETTIPRAGAAWKDPLEPKLLEPQRCGHGQALNALRSYDLLLSLLHQVLRSSLYDVTLHEMTRSTGTAMLLHLSEHKIAIL